MSNQVIQYPFRIDWANWFSIYFLWVKSSLVENVRFWICISELSTQSTIHIHSVIWGHIQHHPHSAAADTIQADKACEPQQPDGDPGGSLGAGHDAVPGHRRVASAGAQSRP